MDRKTWRETFTAACIAAVILLASAELVYHAHEACLTAQETSRTERNQWGQRGPTGCETLLQWTQQCQ